MVHCWLLDRQPFPTDSIPICQPPTRSKTAFYYTYRNMPRGAEPKQSRFDLLRSAETLWHSTVSSHWLGCPTPASPFYVDELVET
jgi:hypothetical protein